MSKTAVLPRTPAWTLGTRPVKRFTGDLQPGPGEYALASHYEVCSTTTTEPAFSIPGGRGTGSRERTPGPSDYRADSRPTLPGKPAYTIAGRQGHASSMHSTPGPGAYAVRGNSRTVGSHPNAPGYSMPASGRPALQSHRLPGPGEYCTEVRKSGPQCSMKFRHAAGRLTGSPVAPPGPGQYAVTTCDRPHSAAYTFGCSRPQSSPQTARDASSSSAMAAFSSAPAHSRAIRGGSFSRTGRGPSGWTEAGPGPGAYQRVEQASRATLHSQPAFTFSSGRSARTLDSKPGPGAYSPSVTATASRKAAFSIQARPHSGKQGSSSPGPGQYGSASSKQHVGRVPNPPHYTFGLKTLGNRESERKPGPAAYNLEMKPSPVAASLKFRHSSKAAQEAAKAMPGPADYTALNRDLCGCKTVRGYTMGQRG